MEQFRQIGEVLGSMRAVMVFSDDIHINPRQCSLLLEFFTCAYESIANEMRENLRFEERQTKWKFLEQPLKELLRIFREAEHYLNQSMDMKNWWAKAISFYQNTDCLDFHVHNLLNTIPIAIEAIEISAEISGVDQIEMEKKKTLFRKKYQREWKDPMLFQWRYGKQYLISSNIHEAWKEDRWVLFNMIKENKIAGLTSSLMCIDTLIKTLNGSEILNSKLLPVKILVESKDYHVRRRLGSGSQYKEIYWLGESFALRHFFGDIEALTSEISLLFSLSHSHILPLFCGFTDDEKKECFLVMELMSRDLGSYIKEICGPRKRVPFSIPVAVDLMLQIARGLEYLHSKKIYHGDLKPSKVLVKARYPSTDGYLHVRITGFGLSSARVLSQKSLPNSSNDPVIWYAPEVLTEQDQMGVTGPLKYTEKADVYSFGMICFEILTGKVPFEDTHLQGDKMSRNIRAGERPLFPFHSPKYIANLTKKCWHADPNQRPSFSSICRILRYMKRFLVMNPDHGHPESPIPPVDYCEIDVRLSGCFSNFHGRSQILQIPFEMFAYRVEEKEKMGSNQVFESGSDGSSICGDDNGTVTFPEEPFPFVHERRASGSQEFLNKKVSLIKKSTDPKANKQQGTPRGRSPRPPQVSPFRRGLRMNSESNLMESSPKLRKTSGHSSDSELP